MPTLPTIICESCKRCTGYDVKKPEGHIFIHCALHDNYTYLSCLPRAECEYYEKETEA